MYLISVQRQKGSGPRGGGGGGRGHQDLDRPSYSQQQAPSAPTNQPPQPASADGADPYAQCKL
jgi:far upstream element-binding protein